MKKLMILALTLLSLSAFAEEKCTDSNFDGLFAENYDKLQYHHRFTKLYEGDSPAPAGYEDIFGEGKYACRDVMVTFLKHNASNKVYAMYTTHEDYCDGGNTLGIIIDMEKHSNSNAKLEDTIVGEIGDSEFYCN